MKFVIDVHETFVDCSALFQAGRALCTHDVWTSLLFNGMLTTSNTLFLPPMAPVHSDSEEGAGCCGGVETSNTSGRQDAESS